MKWCRLPCNRAISYRMRRRALSPGSHQTNSPCRPMKASRVGVTVPRSKESIRRHNRKYYLAHREALKAKRRAAWAADSIPIRRANRRSYLKHRARRLVQAQEQSRAYYQQNRDAVRRRHAIYRVTHPEVMKAGAHNRRARVLAAEGHASGEQVQARIAMWGFRCYVCGAPWQEVDHVKPIAAGGSNWPANLRPICLSCNRRKGCRWRAAA